MIADATRAVIAMFGGFSLAVTGWTLVVYFRRAGWTRDIGALLVRKNTHIALVATAYSLLTVGGIVELIGRITDPASWRIPFYAVAFLIGNVAQWSLLQYERRTSRAAR